MLKVNKRLNLILIAALIMGVLAGCGGGSLPSGVENKSFIKDMDKLYDLTLKSMSEQKYYENDINKILDKMSTSKYTNKLNPYEASMLELSKDILVRVKEDLTTGERIIQSETLEEVTAIMETMGILKK